MNFVNKLHYIMLSAYKSMIPHNMLSLYFITYFGRDGCDLLHYIFCGTLSEQLWQLFASNKTVIL